jgi:hypothetical protein
MRRTATRTRGSRTPAALWRSFARDGRRAFGPHRDGTAPGTPCRNALEPNGAGRCVAKWLTRVDPHASLSFRGARRRAVR